MKRALVTGCAGFIGSHLTESLLADGVRVTGVDCFNNNYGRSDKLENLALASEWDAFQFVPIDLARGDLDELIVEVECVFHLAAEPGVRASWGERFDSYLRNNVLATHHLLQAMVANPGPRLVFASSSSIYGQADSFPTREDALPRPFSPYGVTKLTAEQLCDSYARNFGLEYIGLRYFSVYGPRQRPDMAFHRFCMAVLQGREIQIYGDGSQTRDFTYVGDTVAATRLAAETEHGVGVAVNVGGGSRVSLGEAVRLLGDISGTEPHVVYDPSQRGDVRDTSADTALAQALLGYRPTVSIADGLEAELAWCAAKLENDSAVA